MSQKKPAERLIPYNCDSLQVMNDIIIYSAITGNYDNPRSDIHVFQDTNRDKFRYPVMNSKIYKVLSHKYFSNSYSIWLDGNIHLKIDSGKLVEEFLGNADIAVFRHPQRTCLYDECTEAKGRLIRELHPLMDEQISDYKKDSMPIGFGLAECGMIIRRNIPIVSEFNTRWWGEICRYTHRDQISFSYVWWQLKDRIKINMIDGNVRSHEYFDYIIH